MVIWAAIGMVKEVNDFISDSTVYSLLGTFVVVEDILLDHWVLTFQLAPSTFRLTSCEGLSPFNSCWWWIAFCLLSLSAGWIIQNIWQLNQLTQLCLTLFVNSNGRWCFRHADLLCSWNFCDLLTLSVDHAKGPSQKHTFFFFIFLFALGHSLIHSMCKKEPLSVSRHQLLRPDLWN